MKPGDCCRIPSCRFKGVDHEGPHKEIDGDLEFWDNSMRPGYLKHREDRPTETLTLTDFLLARIADDEVAARHEWEWERPHWAGCERIWVADHHDPGCTCNMQARVLAECEAKRRIVREYEILRAMWVDKLDPGIGVGFHALGKCLAALALPYADHSEFRDEWRP